MLARQLDPIAAIATATGRGAVGIVRISGKAIAPIMDALCGRHLVPRQASYLAFRDARGQPIDQGLALFFPAPNSFTGEDVLELQAHGGPVVLQLLLARCLQAATEIDATTGQPRLPGLRVAQPGEFTERAFLNDKIDLAQAEAIADLIDASTETAARSAARSLSGEFSKEVAELLAKLVHLRMLVEATLDFPEEDIDFLQQADASGQLQSLQSSVATVMQRAVQGAILREGIKVVIAGQPNAGKSSLLNALAGADLAIVTAIAGTTRDKVSQLIQIDGVPLHVVDTAGLRDRDAPDMDPVEKIGIARAWEEIQSADAVLFLHDLTRQHLAPCRQNKSLTNGSPFPGDGGDVHLVAYPNLELTRRDVKQPLTQDLRLSRLAAAVIEGGVQRRQHGVLAKCQVCRVAATTPGARLHGARLQLLGPEPLANPARLRASRVTEKALRAAIAQAEIGRVTNTGHSGCMTNHHRTAARAQQNGKSSSVLCVHPGPASG